MQALGFSVCCISLAYTLIKSGTFATLSFPGSGSIVPYSSSHLDNVESELIVKSGHSVQQNPAAIREVRRILLLHLQKDLGVK